MIRVVLFEDNKNLRESLALYLSGTEGIWFSGAFPDAREAGSVIRKHKPDVVLMDIQMPHRSGIEAMIEIKKNAPTLKVLIQTVFEDDDKIFQAICSGASGYVVKNPDPRGVCTSDPGGICRRLTLVTEYSAQGGGDVSAAVCQKRTHFCGTHQPRKRSAGLYGKRPEL